MPRKVEGVRIGPRERRLLEAAASREGSAGWTTFMRERALDAAVEVLEQDIDDLRPDRERREVVGAGR